MLSQVLEALRLRQWFDTSLPFEKSIHMTQANVLWMLLSRDGEPVLHVKFSQRFDLEREAARYAAASKSYPGRLAPLVGHARHGEIDIMVCQAVTYQTPDPRAMFYGRLHPPLRSHLAEYFASMRNAHAIDSAADVDNQTLLATLHEHFDRSANGPRVRALLSDPLPALLRELPAAPQHGDFALTNLGVTRSGLVLFDWEDYGLFELPGLDLFTLLLSIAWANGCEVTDTLRPKHPLNGFVTIACSAMGLSLAQFGALMPIYTLTFRYLKRNYGAGVRAHLDRLIDRLEPARGSV